MIGVEAVLVLRCLHRADSESKVKRAILVANEPLQSVGALQLLFRQIGVNLFKQFAGSVVLALVVPIPMVAAEECLHHSPVRAMVILEILAVDFRVFLLLQLVLNF